MKYRTIKTPPPHKGNITLEDAIAAAKAVKALFSNGSRRPRNAKEASALLKGIPGVLLIPKSEGGSALKQSHSKPASTAKTKRRLTIGKKAAPKSASARKK